ncbi:hypothetical protein QJQ45_006256 [Haematococcus lacustris]|nr:hypothetical protein QJQ45_006256 [Haematococcus lacustris]
MMCWAKNLQEKLLLSPGILHGHEKRVSIDFSQYLLKFMAQPALQQPGNRDEHRQAMEAMLCVPHDGQPTLQRLPSPLLFTRRGDSALRLFWKDVDGTWSSLMQHWVEVKWIAISPRGQWVLGLKAADSARPAAVSLGSQRHLAAPAAAPPPPPYPQQQGVRVEQASMARQAAPAAPEPPAFPAAAPTLLSGPEPPLGPAACPGAAGDCFNSLVLFVLCYTPSSAALPAFACLCLTDMIRAAHDLAAMREEVVGHSARPGTQFVAIPWRAASVLATALPEADPQPHIDSWTQLKCFNDRTLEYLPKPMALQFGLHECGVDKVELLVVLVHPSGSTGADQGPGSLQLPYEATYGHVAAGATMTTTPPDGASYPLCDPEPELQHGAVSGEEGSLGPGCRTGMKRKAADADADVDQSPEAGQAAAAASVKRHLGCGPHEPDLVAGVPQPASDQGPEEMEVAPAALPEASAPADVKPNPGQQPGPLAAKDLLVTVGAMMDEHLPASEMPMFKDVYKRMEEWVNSPDGAAQLVQLRKAHTWNHLVYSGRTSKMSAWTLWESIQRILGQTPTTTSSSNAGQARGTREEPIELSDDTGDEADAGVLPDLLPGWLQVAHA